MSTNPFKKAIESRKESEPIPSEPVTPVQPSLNQNLKSGVDLQGVKVAKTLLANYFFMSGIPILRWSDLQNSISFGRRTTKFQGL